MRILWLTENYPPRRGGMAQSCDRIVSGLRKSGLTIDVGYFNKGATAFKSVKQQNGLLISVPVSDAPAHTLNCFFNYLTDPANKFSYTHIVAFGGSLPMTALPIYKTWLNVKAVTMLRGNDFDLSVFMPNKRIVLFDALNASDAVCVLSTDTRDKIKKLFPSVQTAKICNGISCDDWFFDSSDIMAAESFKIKHSLNSRLNIGIIGQIKEKKGIVFFLESVLKGGYNETFNFIVVGDVEEGVQQWIAERKEYFNILFLPFMDRYELLRIYPACDYIALPSHYDGMPNVLMEACALGKPLIAAKTGGISEVLPVTQDKLAFFPGNMCECIEALGFAATMSDEERQKLSQNLKRHVCDEFSAELEIKKYRELFENMV